MNSDPCAICLESLHDSKNPVGCTPCGHCFHMKCYEEWKLTKRRCRQPATCPTCNQFVKDFHRICLELDGSMKILRKTFGLLESEIEKQQQQHQQKQHQQQHQQQPQWHQRQQWRSPPHQLRQPKQICSQQQHYQKQEVFSPHQHQQELQRQKPPLRRLQQQTQRSPVLYGQTNKHQLPPQNALSGSWNVCSKQHSNQKKKCRTSRNNNYRQRIYHPFKQSLQYHDDMIQKQQQENLKLEYDELLARMNVLQIVESVQESIVSKNRIDEQTDVMRLVSSECNRILYKADIIARRNSCSSNSTTISATGSHCSPTAFLRNQSMHHRGL